MSGGRNKGPNFGNVAVESETAGDMDRGSGSGIGRNLEGCHFGRDHMKRECQKRAEKKEKKG